MNDIHELWKWFCSPVSWEVCMQMPETPLHFSVLSVIDSWFPRLINPLFAVRNILVSHFPDKRKFHLERKWNKKPCVTLLSSYGRCGKEKNAFANLYLFQFWRHTEWSWSCVVREQWKVFQNSARSERGYKIRTRADAFSFCIWLLWYQLDRFHAIIAVWGNVLWCSNALWSNQENDFLVPVMSEDFYSFSLPLGSYSITSYAFCLLSWGMIIWGIVFSV